MNFANGTVLYKVFSAEPLEEALKNSLFPEARVMAQHDWLAYPR